MAQVLAYTSSIPRQIEEALMEEDDASSVAASYEGQSVDGLHIRTQAETPISAEAGALVVHTGGDLTPKGDDQPQDQLTELLQELGMIEAQQEKLRDAVKHNKGIVVHPRPEVMEESESEHGDTPKAPTPKKRLIVSGGLTGFGIAQDLLQIDFSPPEEAPEEFKAVAFFEEPKQIKPGLSGSFGSIDPASKEMHHYLERLEEQQKLVLELITGKKQALLEHMQSKDSLRNTKQGGRARGQKSRLGRNGGRLDETKSAVADALSLSAGDKDLSLNAKMGSLALGTNSKGSLATKLPIIANSSSIVRADVKPERREPKSRATPAQVRKVAPAPVRKAQVQRADLDAKEQEEMRALFAKPLPGTTPSTQHMAGKNASQAAQAAAKAASETTYEFEANPYFSPKAQRDTPGPSPTETPAATPARDPTLQASLARTPSAKTPDAKDLKVKDPKAKAPSTSQRGRGSSAGPSKDGKGEVAQGSSVEQKCRMFGGFRKFMRSKSKT